MSLKFEDEYLIKLLADLVNIPSVFPDEYEVMLFLERELARIGLSTERIPVSERRFNLLTRLGSGSPVLCLNSHSDTVPPNGDSVPTARIDGGVMHGLGSADDKASLAAMIAAVKAIAESGARLKGTLDLLISVDEEGEARGVRTAIKDGYRCDMAVTGEPTSLEIVPTHCGLVFLDIVTHGKSAHGCIPTEGVNAIDRMYDLVSGLRAAITDFPAHPLVGPPTLNLGIMRGGDRPNRVPDRCEASVDFRLVPPMTLTQVLARVEDYFGKWGDQAEYTVTKQCETLDTAHDSPLVGTLAAVGERASGTKPSIGSWRGWTEAESFQTGLGIDAVVFGPGDIRQAHSSNEFVELDEVRQAARIYADTVLAVLGETA